MSGDLLFKKECYQIVGLCMKVHSKLGMGFKEIVYKDALAFELQANGVLFEREKAFTILYEGLPLKHTFNADFLVFHTILLEIKAASFTHPDAFKQTLNYLKASNIQLGILINFGTPKLQFNRIVCTY